MRTRIKVGDNMEIPVHNEMHPEAGHFGKVVYISEDEKTVTIQCDKKHDGKTLSLKVRINSQK